MLKCKDVTEYTSHYLEGDLPWHRKLSWGLHLFMCGPCKRFVRQFKLSIIASSSIGKKTIKQEEAKELADKVKSVCTHKTPPQ